MSACGHEYVIGNVAYACERQPHPTDGYDAEHRHAAPIDAEMAKGTDGQDWAIAWGPAEAYPDGGDQ